MLRLSRRSLFVAGGLLSLAALTAVGLMVPTLVPADAATTSSVHVVYMAPAGAGGSDSNDGRTPATAVASLHRVQQLLHAAKPTTDVEIRIKQGVYVAAPLGSWTFYVPGHTVSFMPIDYDPGDGMSGIAGRPIFRNLPTKPNGAWLTARLGGALPTGGSSQLRFYYLQVEQYSDGLGLMGLEYGKDTDGGNPPYFARTSNGLNDNRLYGMVFKQIGTRWTGDNSSYGWGAVVLTNSSRNKISNSHFINVENATSRRGVIHAVYVTHFSSDNVIERSAFRYVSGAPTKVRDRSSRNIFQNNVFEKTGIDEYYRDDTCDEECLAKEPGARAAECSGYGNRFINNELRSGYIADHPAHVWWMYPWKPTPEEMNHYAGTPGKCSLPSGETRLRTWGNVRL